MKPRFSSVLRILAVLSFLIGVVWLFQSRKDQKPSVNIEISRSYPAPPPKLNASAQPTEQSEERKADPPKMPDWLKPRKAPSEEEIQQFLSIATDKASAYAWAYIHTKDPKRLMEGLAAFPQDRKLNYLAALLSEEALKSDPSLAGIKEGSIEFLRQHFPGVASFLSACDQKNPVSIETVRDLYNGREELYFIDAEFRFTDESFLTSIRDHSLKQGKIESMYPRFAGVTTKLHELAGSANTQLSDVARLILSGGDLVDSALVGARMQNEIVQNLEDADVISRFGSDKQEYVQSIQNDFSELEGLKRFRENMYANESEEEILRFHQLRRELGERDALREMFLSANKEKSSEDTKQ